MILPFLVWTATAGPPPTDEEVAAAEVERRSFQMIEYAKRHAWTGVERSYLASVATGAPVSADGHLMGAEAARERGDINAFDVRLRAAFAAEDRPEIFDQILELKRSYGAVKLEGRVLEAQQIPFDPVRLRVLQAADKALKTVGFYEGLLPRGTFRLDGVEFHLLLGRPAVQLLTTPRPALSPAP